MAREDIPACNPTAGPDPTPALEVLLEAQDRLELLYRHERHRLHRFFAGRTVSPDIADLVQETFRRLLGVLARTNQPIERPDAYLTRVAQSVLRDQARYEARHPSSTIAAMPNDEPMGSDPVTMLEARDLLARIERALPRLKPKTRIIFLLHRVDGLRYVEIAEQMGMSVKAVEQHMSKALRVLRRHSGAP